MCELSQARDLTSSIYETESELVRIAEEATANLEALWELLEN